VQSIIVIISLAVEDFNFVQY